METVDSADIIELDADGNDVSPKTVDASSIIELDVDGNEISPPPKAHVDKMMNATGYPSEGVQIWTPEQSQKMLDDGDVRVKEKMWKAAASTLSDNPLTKIGAGLKNAVVNANPVAKMQAIKEGREAPGFVDEYRKGRDSAKAEVEAATKEVSPTVAGVPVLPMIGQSVPFLAAGAPVTVGGRLALGGISGAVNGALASEGDLTQGEVGEVVKDSLIGGGIGLGVAGAIEGATAGVKRWADKSIKPVVDSAYDNSDKVINKILDFIGVKPEAKPAIMADPALKAELLKSFSSTSNGASWVGPTRAEVAQNARNMASQAAQAGNTSELAGIGPMSKLASQAGQIPKASFDASRPISSAINTAAAPAVERLKSGAINRGIASIEKAMETLETKGYGNLSPFQLDGLKRQLSTLAGMSQGDRAAYTYALSLSNPIFNTLMQESEKDE